MSSKQKKVSLKDAMAAGKSEAALKVVPTPAPQPATASKTRVHLNTRVSPETLRQLQTVAFEQNRKQQDLMSEALNDLFAKYGKPKIA